MDWFDLLFNAQWIEHFLGLIGGIFGASGEALIGDAGGSALGDVLSAGVMGSGTGAGESLFARLLGGDLADMYLNYLFARDVFGFGTGGQHRHTPGFESVDSKFFEQAGSPSADFKSIWHNLEEEQRRQFEPLMKIVESQDLFLKQLKVQSERGKVPSALYDDYKALGLALPGAALLKDAHRKLIYFLHPDREPAITRTEIEKVAKALNEAHDLLRPDKNKHIAVYERVLKENEWHKNILQKFFDALGSFHEKVEEKAHLFLTGPQQAAGSGISNKFSNLSSGQKAGLAFGAVVAVGAGAYLAAKFFDTRRKKRLQRELGARSAMRGEEAEPILSHREQTRNTRHASFAEASVS